MQKAQMSGKVLQNFAPIIRDEDLLTESEFMSRFISVLGFLLVAGIIVGTIFGIRANVLQARLTTKQLQEYEEKEKNKQNLT